ncbi:MAG: leucine-rich repeat protein [Bacteroidaceae bacterium]|nr:leucine-rich repeat protein [Bacteroidaceae bacterium]
MSERMNDIDPSVFVEAGVVATHEGRHIVPQPLGESATSLLYSVNVGGKMVFMKRLRPNLLCDTRVRSLFRKEYEVGSRLSHPNVVQYERMYEGDDDCYLLMEHIQGQTLAECIAFSTAYFTNRRNLDKFVGQLLAGVGYLHEQNVLHGDLKPQNIMLTQVNNDVKIIDLGFCFCDSYTDTVGMTRKYAAPEQLDGEVQKLDRSSDIYCIGKILEYLDQHLRRGLPLRYRSIMKRCLKEEKSQRYGSVDEILQYLNRRWWNKKRVWSAVAAILVLAGSVWSVYQERPEPLYDGVKYGIGYKILSEESRTCEAVCHTNKAAVKDIVLHSSVLINGKEYRVVSVADSSFVDDSLAVSIHIPEGVERIGEAAFRDIKNITLLNIPNSVKYIGKEAFMGMDNLAHLSIGSGIDTIYERTFACDTSLVRVEIPEGVKTLKLDAFAGCWSLKYVTLPSTLTTIERGVFYECTSLEEITLPASVHAIGEYSFYHCDRLTDIYNYSPVPQPSLPIVQNASGVTLHVPQGSADLYRRARYWQDMNIVEITE